MVEFRRKSDMHYFKGKASWVKLYSPDVKYEPQWSLRVHLDQPSLALFNRLKEGSENVSGIMNDINMDEDGEYVTFRRYVRRRWNGREVELTPPIVVDKNNKPMRNEIGNGSDVTVKVVCYTYKPKFSGGKVGSAIRLESVRVDNLVEFDRSQYTEDQQKQVEGLDRIPSNIQEEF